MSLSILARSAPSVTKANNAAPDARVNLNADSALETKDLRAYEHERRRVKKAADTLKMRARKWAAPKSLVQTPVSNKDKLLKVDDVDTLDGVLIESKAANRNTFSGHGTFEVRLSDLIVPSKPPKRADSDFEVIPHVRSVIVLDDSGAHDLPGDEPWEHIDSEDDDKDSSTAFKRPSYASILSTN